jgi:NAD(P)-dependent dehydrogenase (short-subunit alcohol dehydrogenase family)
MTKAALVGLVRGAAIDLAPRAITVNNVQPGPTATDMSSRSGGYAWGSASSASNRATLSRTVPMNACI